MKKLAFITHEFGLFPGHGGVASYLYLLVSEIISKRNDYDIYIITYLYDKKSALIKHNRVHIIEMSGDNYHAHGCFILNKLVKIQPDFAEFTDYLGLGVESLTYRAETKKNALSNTVFVTLHHTASRECYEWNDKVPVTLAPHHIREAFVRERTQMKLSDLNVAPSTFMEKYVKKNYFLKDVTTISHPLMLDITPKKALLQKVSQEYDLDVYKDAFVVNCISRIEGRKNQQYLIEQFIKFIKRTHANALLLLVGNSSVNTVTLQDFKSEVYSSVPDNFREYIHFYDFMDSEGKKRILSISDLSVLASPFECLSLAMTESVCVEVPAIVSKYCGFSDYMDSCKKNMTFDPFSEDDLSNKLEHFYYLSTDKKKQIVEEQLNCLKVRAGYKNAIEKRLNLYEKAQNTNRYENAPALVIDETNFLETVTENLLKIGYKSIVVSWYFDKKNNKKLVSLFHSVSSHFTHSEILFYGGNINQLCFLDLIINYIPFCIINAKLDSSMIGLPLWKAAITNCTLSQRTYGLLDKLGGFQDVVDTVSDTTVQKREYFRKSMLDHLFMSKNELCLEDLYED